MRTMLMATIFAAGCLGTYVPGDPTPTTGSADMAQAAGGGGGGGGAAGGGGGGGGGAAGGGGGGVVVASTDMAGAPAGDMAGTITTAKNFGDTCAGPVTTPATQADCSTGLLCAKFVMGTVQRCTKPCTYVSQTQPAPECSNPPSAGLCTTNNYCKFTQ